MRIVYLIIFLLVSFVVVARPDSTNIRLTEVWDVSSQFSGKTHFKQVDTILNQFYHYNLDARDNSISQGNPGLSYGSMLFSKVRYGFSTGETSFGSNFKENTGSNVFHTTEPFARVSYRSGPKKYQDFDVFFTQNINKNLNFAVSYNTQSSTGFYINQTTETRQFSLQNSFKTVKGRYGYMASFKVNSGNALENGGIKSDSLYSELTKLNPFDIDNSKLKVQVWLEDDSNYYDHRNLYLTQFFKLFSKKIDSLNQRELVFGLTNEGGYDDLWFTGKNSDSNYYARYGINIVDSSSIYDQSHLFYLRNDGYLKLVTGKGNSSFSLGVNYNYFENENVNNFTSLYEFVIYGKVSDFRLGPISTNVVVKKGLDGFNSQGYYGKLDFNFNLKPGRIQVALNFKTQSTLPEYKTLNYAGNALAWRNDFGYVGSSSIGFEIRDSKLKLEVEGEFESLTNYVYYDTDTYPKQFETEFGRYFIQLKKKFVVKSFHFEVSAINQGVASVAPVNLSKWIFSATVYHQRFLIKDAMELRYGFDYWQYSSYYAPSYTPFNRSFSYQNAYAVGDFPYLNFYISARIKSAQGFVNFQNIGQFIFRDNYMMIPDYALQDFGISFGLRWDFYN
ncbi:MAG: hypothetical protein ACJAWO_000510 [Halieaceae bacterium]|jgi:hypothetical protein